MGKHCVHDGTHLAVDRRRQAQRFPRVRGSCQEPECRHAIGGDRDDGMLASATPLAEDAAVEHAKRNATTRGNWSTAFGAPHERLRVAEKHEQRQFGVCKECPHDAVGKFVRGVGWIMGNT
jgi:hypothetical protein